MAAYILRRLLLVIPTLFGIMLINFTLTQFVPGGPIEQILGMLPGMGNLKEMAAARNQVDDKQLARVEAIINSMTPRERQNHQIINGQRRKRIAKGSGTSVEEVNKLLKQHLEMSRMMKQVSKLGQKGLQRHGIQGLLGR